MAIQHDPKNQLAYFNKGNLYFANHRYEDAEKMYTKAIELKPLDTFSYINRALSKVMLKDYDGAFKDLDKCIKIDPNSAQAYSNKGYLYQLLGNDPLLHFTAQSLILIE